MYTTLEYIRNKYSQTVSDIKKRQIKPTTELYDATYISYTILHNAVYNTCLPGCGFHFAILFQKVDILLRMSTVKRVGNSISCL